MDPLRPLLVLAHVAVPFPGVAVALVYGPPPAVQPSSAQYHASGPICAAPLSHPEAMLAGISKCATEQKLTCSFFLSAASSAFGLVDVEDTEVFRL